MTKKHFISLAEVIKYWNRTTDQPFTYAQISELADWCWRNNGRFNRSRWLAYIAGECGPNGGAVKKAKAS